MNGRGTAIVVATFATLVVALAAGFVVLRVYTPPTSASPPSVPEVRQFRIHMHASEAGEITMHYWTPAVIVVNAGDTVILKVTNGDPNSSHGFSLAAFRISAPAIAPGKSETFRFRAMRPGIYHYGCGLTGCASDHADQVGQLVVLGK